MTVHPTRQAAARRVHADLHCDECVDDSPYAPTGYAHRVSARLYTHDSFGERHFIGEARVTQIQGVAAGEYGLSVQDVAAQATNADVAALFDRRTGELNHDTRRVLGDTRRARNILVLDHMILLPCVRGQGVGLRVARYLMGRLGRDMRLCLIRPEPMQFQPLDWLRQYECAGISLDRLGRDYRVAHDNLSRYAERLGFVGLADGAHLAFDMTRAMPAAFQAA